MANPIKGEVTLKMADGRQFLLVADNEALIQAATAYGKGMRTLFRDMQPPVDAFGNVLLDDYGEPMEAPFAMAAMRALLFGMLTAYHGSLTLRDASEILMSGDAAVMEAIERAIKLSHPDLAPSAEGKAPPSAPVPPMKTPRGKTSGRSGAKRG